MEHQNHFDELDEITVTRDGIFANTKDNKTMRPLAFLLGFSIGRA